MKKILMFCMTISLLLIGCASTQKHFTVTSEVIGTEQGDKGTVNLKAWGYAKDIHDAVVDAQKKAFYAVLFRGVPGTEAHNPLISNEKETRMNNQSYFDSFFASRYKTFIISSIEKSPLVSTTEGPGICVGITINYYALRNDLEQEDIIRKFGY